MHAQTHARTITHTLNSPFLTKSHLSFLSSLCCTHTPSACHPTVSQPSFISSTSAFSTPSAAQSAVIYVITSHRPVCRPDIWHYRQLQPRRMLARHEREHEHGNVFWGFFPDTKTLLFPFQSSTCQVFHFLCSNNTNMMNLCQITADMINTLVPKYVICKYIYIYICYMFFDLYAFLCIILTHVW